MLFTFYHSSCPDKPAPCDHSNLSNPGPSPQLLKGALVGGPDSSDNYQDKREDYTKNEVACDYNAGFQSALAGIYILNIQMTRIKFEIICTFYDLNVCPSNSINISNKTHFANIS